jgi:uncharacterized Zn-binding protein involved in type VI secretion
MTPVPPGLPIIPPTSINVLIGFLPAARMTDRCACIGPPPANVDLIAMGSPTVLINGLFAARMGDPTVKGGAITTGCFNVLIGDAAFVMPPVAPPPMPAPPGPGQPSAQSFASQEAAAIAALSEANPQSIAANQEYGGLIYRNADGTYGYTVPSPGDGTSFNPSSVSAPPGATVVGDYHTHGDYSVSGADGNPQRTSDPARDDYNSDNFSRSDIRGIRNDAAGNPDYRGYLGTPSGTFREYNPHTDTIRTIP